MYILLIRITTIIIVIEITNTNTHAFVFANLYNFDLILWSIYAMQCRVKKCNVRLCNAMHCDKYNAMQCDYASRILINIMI